MSQQGVTTPHQGTDTTLAIIGSGPQKPEDLEKYLDDVRKKAKTTGHYIAALLTFVNIFPIFAAQLSIALYYIALPQLLWPHLSITLSDILCVVSGTISVVICWLLIAIPYRRVTAVDRANSSSYEQLLNRLHQITAWYAILSPQPPPNNDSLYAIKLREIARCFRAICESLKTKTLSWMLASGYVNAWKQIHRIDEAFISIEPIEAVIYDALHDEMSLQDSTIKNKEALLNRLRRAVRTLDARAAIYLNQQPPQNSVITSAQPLSEVPPSTEHDTTLGQGICTSSHASDEKIQARTIIHEVRLTLHQFRDDRWEKLIRVRNQLIKLTAVTGLVLFGLVEFAIIINVGTEMLKTAMILFYIGGLVGLFSRLYDQSKTDTSIDDFRLSTVRLIAAPLYSGLAALGGVLVVQREFVLTAPTLLMAAAFGLTPSLFTNAIQKEADQYKADLKSTSAPGREKVESSSR